MSGRIRNRSYTGHSKSSGSVNGQIPPEVSHHHMCTPIPRAAPRRTPTPRAASHPRTPTPRAAYARRFLGLHGTHHRHHPRIPIPRAACAPRFLGVHGTHHRHHLRTPIPWAAPLRTPMSRAAPSTLQLLSIEAKRDFPCPAFSVARLKQLARDDLLEHRGHLQK